ncbi:MAG: WYL domain-containing protein [Synergistaceae bacterium]|nr:WYL domain-containing protein [Synergistaceae bacterium]
MARAITSFRIRRLLNLVTFLRKKGEYGAEVADIMDYCEYNDRRALQEDIRMLRDEYRTEIIFKRKKPYRYCLKSEGDFLLSLNLNEEDVIALAAGLGMVSHFIPPMENNCKFLWDKIKKILPENLVNFGQWLSGVATVATPVSGMNAEIFNTILKALRDKSMLELNYTSPYKKRETHSHILAPWGIFFRAHAWYLLAGKQEQQIPYVFRISRISKAEIRSDIVFIEKPKNYSQEIFTASAWYAAPGELNFNIKLKIVEPMATIVMETTWNPTQQTRRIDKDTIELTANVPDLKEAALWVLSSAPYITVEEPYALREIVWELAQKMMTLNSI